MNPSNKKSNSISEKKGGFNAQAFLDSAGVERKIKEFKGGGLSTPKVMPLRA
jgi:hypothetical protein